MTLAPWGTSTTRVWLFIGSLGGWTIVSHRFRKVSINSKYQGRIASRPTQKERIDGDWAEIGGAARCCLSLVLKNFSTKSRFPINIQSSLFFAQSKNSIQILETRRPDTQDKLIFSGAHLT